MEEEKATQEQEAPIQDSGASEENIKAVQFTPLTPVQAKSQAGGTNIDMLLDIQIPILVELGKTEMEMREVLALSPGSIIELDSLAGEPVKITIRDKVIAHGEVVVVDENFGVKITKIINPQDRIKTME